jgi:hypothetical protein
MWNLLERDPEKACSGTRIAGHRALALCLSMIFSENRCTPIGSQPEGMLFRIMLHQPELLCAEITLEQ